MLRHLRVTNFAILSDVAIEFGPGMNVLTGETGAGKSLIVEAVNLLRGGRASADIPRTGADEAVVEAVVEVPSDLANAVQAVLADAGVPPSDGDEVFIRRVIQRGGRSRTYINGGLTTAAKLALLGALLVDLSGQHEHQGLVDAQRHLDILDAFANQADTVAAMEQAWSHVTAIQAELATLTNANNEREARLDFLRFVVDEFERLAPQPTELEALGAERQKLAAVDQLVAIAAGAQDALWGGSDCAHDKLAKANRELERGKRFDEGLGEIAKTIGEAKSLVADAAAELRRYVDKLEGNPERLAAIDDRLASLKQFVRKHGSDLPTAIAAAHGCKVELDQLTAYEQNNANLQGALANAMQKAASVAGLLHKARVAAAKTLEAEVGASLAELAMGAAKLRVVVSEAELGKRGSDYVEFRLASNKGEDEKSLAKVASGGELSRIMLSLKLALRSADDVATYVFDEVDTGIGGATANVVGKQIRGVAAHRQVLCVTHLPQIAAFADHHFQVAKSEVAGRTETAVTMLSEPGRRDELARMLGGQATAKARAHADELLSNAHAEVSRAVTGKETKKSKAAGRAASAKAR